MTTLTDHSPSGTWAGHRLRLGQANVGFWVLTSLVVLSVPLPEAGALSTQVLAWVGVVAAYTALQAPFDLVGGYLLPKRHGRTDAGFGTWLGRWSRGVAIHGGVLASVGAAALAADTAGGVWAGVATSLLAGGLLVAFQGGLASWMSGARPGPVDPRTAEVLGRVGISEDRARILDVPDAGFVGGWVGPRGLETLWLPAHWARSLTPEVLEIAVLRRHVALSSGARATGLLAALGFNAVGLLVVLAVVPGTGFSSAAGLLWLSAGCTLWTFLGLLTLPSASREAVTRLDRIAAVRVGDRTRVARAIERLDRDQEDEADRGPWVETIFHPVPSPTSRAAALGASAGSGPVAWRVTRMMLFTSWAQLSWLGRSVHCNAGRPDLWALLPGD